MISLIYHIVYINQPSFRDKNNLTQNNKNIDKNLISSLK